MHASIGSASVSLRSQLSRGVFGLEAPCATANPLPPLVSGARCASSPTPAPASALRAPLSKTYPEKCILYIVCYELSEKISVRLKNQCDFGSFRNKHLKCCEKVCEKCLPSLQILKVIPCVRNTTIQEFVFVIVCFYATHYEWHSIEFNPEID